MRALIIGGGIGGLTAALALRRAGLDVIVFEQAEHVQKAEAGVTLWCNATRILQALGFAEALPNISAALELEELRTASGRVLASIPLEPLGQEFSAPIFGCLRADLTALLAQQLGDDFIRTDHRLESFAQDADSVTAKFANGLSIDGDLLIGADGIHTVVRSQILGDPPRYCGYVIWCGSASQPAGWPDRTSVCAYGRGAQFALLPIGAGRVFWFATVKMPQPAPTEADRGHAELLSRFSTWHAPIPYFLKSLDPTTIFCAPVFDRPPATTWGRGRVTLLGAAAHATSPFLGQATGLALESAYALGRHLAMTPHVVPALRAYEAERYVRTARIIRKSWRIGSAAHWTAGWACWLRDRALCWTPLPLHSAALRRIIRSGCMPLDLAPSAPVSVAPQV